MKAKDLKQFFYCIVTFVVAIYSFYNCQRIMDTILQLMLSETPNQNGMFLLLFIGIIWITIGCLALLGLYFILLDDDEEVIEVAPKGREY